MLSNFLLDDIEAARKRRSYWAKLKLARADYFNDTVENEHPRPEGFYYYLQLKWGIKVMLDKDNNITEEVEIIDEGKYLMFLMKYGS